MWVGPVPGLEVAPQPLQVHGGEVGADAFPQPPLPLRRAAAARLTEPVPEMFPPNPPEEEERRGWKVWVSVHRPGGFGSPSLPGGFSAVKRIVVDEREDGAVVGQQTSGDVDHPLALLIRL